jgi:hypothetical protein
MKRISNVRWRRFLLIIGALVIGLTQAVAAPTTAAATDFNSGQFCYFVIQNRVIVRVICRPLFIQVAVQWPRPPDPCRPCGPAFLWRDDPVLPESIENSISQGIVSGLTVLGQAAAATSQPSRDAFRAEAMRTFTNVARNSLGTRLSLQQVGLANPANNTFDPTPQPWSSWFGAAGQNVADGMALLKQYLQSPAGVPAPAALLAMATAQFDEAYIGLSEQVVIEG